MKRAIHLIAAARPNFMKIAPLYHALKDEPWSNPVIVHTGQHYDTNMSDTFFDELRLPKPHFHLGTGRGSQAEQTGQVMIAYEKLLLETQPDMVVVVGDVNSTVACTLAAVKINYTNNRQIFRPHKINRPLVGHLEAGLRSFDRTMPEEINRIVTDSLADILWTPSIDGNQNLENEGIAQDKIEMVGNIMIDSLEFMRQRIEKEKTFTNYGMVEDAYGLVTFHRPSNVDDPKKLQSLCLVLREVAEKIPLIFPVHPRTRKNLKQNNLLHLLQDTPNISLDGPLSYINFMNLVFNSKIIITDSGGIQEETTYLGIPCLTLRENTERPITISRGSNRLCNIDNVVDNVIDAISDSICETRKPDLWDGKTANRVAETIAYKLNATYSG